MAVTESKIAVKKKNSAKGQSYGMTICLTTCDIIQKNP